MLPVLEFLQRRDLLRRGQPNKAQITRMSLRQLHDIAEEAVELSRTPPVTVRRVDSAHFALPDISGNIYPCEALECRRKTARSLASFVALYSDCVYFENFLDRHCHTCSNHDLDEARMELWRDLRVVGDVAPLIKAGLLVFVAPAREMCWRCTVEDAIGTAPAAQLAHAARRLKRELSLQLDVHAERFDEDYAIICAANKLLERSPRCFVYSVLPAPLSQMPRLLKRIDSGERVQLSRSVVRALKLADRLAREVAFNVGYSAAASHVLSASPVTSNPLHIRALMAMGDSETLDNCNTLIARHMRLLVPFAADIAPTELIRLRNRERGSFVCFRTALAQAVREIQSRTGTFTASDARSLYEDVLRPEIARLDISYTSATKHLRRRVLADGCGLLASITFGLFSGFAQMNPAQVAGAIGLSTFANRLLCSIGDSGQPRSRARENNMYFLWQATKLTSRQ